MCTPAIVRGNRTCARPHKASCAALSCRSAATAAFHIPQHSRNVFRNSQQAFIFRLTAGLLLLRLIQNLRTLVAQLIYLRLLSRQLGLRRLDFLHLRCQLLLAAVDFVSILFELVQHRQIAADNLLQQIHTRGKIAEILGAQKHIKVIYLAVDINITQTLAVDDHALVNLLLLFIKLGLILVDFILQNIALGLQAVGLCLQLTKIIHNLRQLSIGTLRLAPCFLLARLHIRHLLLDIVQLCPLIISGIGKAQGAEQRQQSNNPCGSERC